MTTLPDRLEEAEAGRVRIVGVAHLYQCEGSDDPRAIPVMIAAPAPARHHNLFALVDGRHPDASGFLLSDGRFADRAEAAQLAIQNGQTTKARMTRPDKLFSEDLW